MACNRETSTDGSTSSASPVCQSPGSARVPCCNSNCRFLGCAATMNFCSKCYSEHILKEGTGAFLTPASDTPVETQDNRSQVQRADKVDDRQCHADNSTESTEGTANASSECGSRVDTASADASSVQVLRSNERSSLRTKTTMRTSPSVSDLSTVFGLANTTSSLPEMSADVSDLPQQPIPSPLSLSPPCPRTASPPAARQVETKLSLPPLVPARQQATNRCLICRKRVGLLGFKCRCGDIFCATHRYSDKHDCSFDYKAAGRAAIARENPVVKANKIERI